MISSTAVLCSITLGLLRETGALIRERPQQDRGSPGMVIRKLIVLVAVSNEQGQAQSAWPGEEGQEGLPQRGSGSRWQGGRTRSRLLERQAWGRGAA